MLGMLLVIIHTHTNIPAYAQEDASLMALLEANDEDEETELARISVCVVFYCIATQPSLFLQEPDYTTLT